MANRGILKQNWERRHSAIILPEEEVARVISSYSPQEVNSCELLSNGCANSNFKITFLNGDPVVLRVYTRDPGSLEREHHIHELVQNLVPVPRFLYINSDKSILPYPFAILQFVEGRLFRDLIFEENKKAIEECAYDAGRVLTKIASFQFDKAGFFKPDLTVKPFDKDQTFYDIILDFLKKKSVIKSLGMELVACLTTLVHDHKDILIDLSGQRSLTHADYDPSNMLVKKERGGWQISAILDWEFAFSSSPSIDMGLMLRYASQLPPFYQQSFLQGIKDSAPLLIQQDWKLRTRLADMLSLLSLLDSEESEKRPAMISDVKRLLKNIINT